VNLVGPYYAGFAIARQHWSQNINTCSQNTTYIILYIAKDRK